MLFTCHLQWLEPEELKILKQQQPQLKPSVQQTQTHSQTQVLPTQQVLQAHQLQQQAQHQGQPPQQLLQQTVSIFWASFQTKLSKKTCPVIDNFLAFTYSIRLLGLQVTRMFR